MRPILSVLFAAVMCVLPVVAGAEGDLDNGRERVEQSEYTGRNPKVGTTTTNFADPAGFLRYELQGAGGDGVGVVDRKSVV